MFRRVPEHNRYSYVTNDGDFSGFEKSRYVKFDLTFKELEENADILHERLAERMGDFPSDTFDEVHVSIDDNQDAGIVKVTMEGHYASRTETASTGRTPPDQER